MAEPTADHATHDPVLVAALADRELAGTERDLARAQVEGCSACASLHAELRALARAIRELPPIARPRDFRLRPEDVQRLRPNLLRRMVGAFGTARDGVSRPLAVGLTTLGLVAMVVGAIPGLSLGQGAGAAGDTTITMQAPAASAGELSQLAGEATPAPDARLPDAVPERNGFEESVPATNMPILFGGALLLALGLGLGAGRLVARRRRGNHPGGRFV